MSESAFIIANFTAMAMLLIAGLVVFVVAYYSDRPHKPDAAE